MLLCVRIEELSRHLGGLQQLVNRYQSGEPTFPDDAIAWLLSLEQLMARLRLPDGSEMSALRGRILKAADQQAGDPPRPRSVVRQARMVAAAEALERAEAVARQRRLEAEERLFRFEDKLCEAVTAAALAKHVPPQHPSWMDWLRDVWRGLVQCETTRPFAVYLSASLLASDRLYLLDRVMSRLADKSVGFAADPGGPPPPAEESSPLTLLGPSEA